MNRKAHYPQAADVNAVLHRLEIEELRQELALAAHLAKEKPFVGRKLLLWLGMGMIVICAVALTLLVVP